LRDHNLKKFGGYLSCFYINTAVTDVARNELYSALLAAARGRSARKSKLSETFIWVASFCLLLKSPMTVWNPPHRDAFNDVTS